MCQLLNMYGILNLPMAEISRCSDRPLSVLVIPWGVTVGETDE